MFLLQMSGCPAFTFDWELMDFYLSQGQSVIFDA